MPSHGSIYVPGASLVHRADGRVKIIVLLAFTVALFWVDGWPGMAVCAVAVLALGVDARLPMSRICALLVPIFVLAAFTVLFNALPPSASGLLRGLFLGLRMVLLVAASFVVCMTSTSTELASSFSALLRPLGRVRVPVDDVSTALSLSLRFIPLLGAELSALRDAQASRGAHFSDGGAWRRAKAWGSALMPLFVGLFRRADRLAASMNARCYGAGPRTHLDGRRFTADDAAELAVGLAFCAAVAVL